MNSSRLENLEKMLLESPNDPFLHYAIAMEYNQSEPEKSWQMLNDMLAKFPDYLPAYYIAAQLGADLSYPVKSKSIFEQGIALARQLGDNKALHELQAAYQNFLIDHD